MADQYNHMFSWGAKVEYSSNGGSTWNAGGDATDIDPGEDIIEMVKNTHLQSQNARHQKKSGLIDGGKFTFKIYAHKSMYSAYQGLERVDTTQWRITAPLISGESTSGSSLVMTAAVSKLSRLGKFEENQMVMMEVELTLTDGSVPNFTAGS